MTTLKLEELTLTLKGTTITIRHDDEARTLGTINVTTGQCHDKRRGENTGSWLSSRGMDIAEVIAAMVVA